MEIGFVAACYADIVEYQRETVAVVFLGSNCCDVIEIVFLVVANSYNRLVSNKFYASVVENISIYGNLVAKRFYCSQVVGKQDKNALYIAVFTYQMTIRGIFGVQVFDVGEDICINLVYVGYKSHKFFRLFVGREKQLLEIEQHLYPVVVR